MAAVESTLSLLANGENSSKIIDIMKKLLLLTLITISSFAVVSAQNKDKDSSLFGYNYYYAQKMNADSLEQILLKRIPEGFEVRDCALGDLTEYHWVHNWSSLFHKGYVIYTFYENGEMTVDLSAGSIPHTTKGYYYLSEIPDLQFDTTRIGNKRGRYLILKFKNDSTVAVKRIVKCSDGSLLEIYDNSCLGMYSLKPLKEPYEEVIKNGYLTIPFEDYGFVVWECSKE